MVSRADGVVRELGLCRHVSQARPGPALGTELGLISWFSRRWNAFAGQMSCGLVVYATLALLIVGRKRGVIGIDCMGFGLA